MSSDSKSSKSDRTMVWVVSCFASNMPKRVFTKKTKAVRYAKKQFRDNCDPERDEQYNDPNAWKDVIGIRQMALH